MKNELLDLGATIVVTEKELLGKGFSEKVKEWTNGGREPVKLGLNCVGGKSATAIAKVQVHRRIWSLTALCPNNRFSYRQDC